MPIEFSAPGTRVSIEVFGEAQEASVEREPLYDPTGARLKS
jgi:glycine cleavage system aminomethyltransferase T